MSNINYLSHANIETYTNHLKNYIKARELVTQGPISLTTQVEYDGETQPSPRTISLNFDGTTLKLNSNNQLYADIAALLTAGNGLELTNGNLHILTNSNDKFLKTDSNGTQVDLSIRYYDSSEASIFGANVKEAYALVGKNGQPITGNNNSQVIKIYKDSSLLDVKVLHSKPATYYKEGDTIPEGKEIGDEKTPEVKPTYIIGSGWIDIAEQYRTDNYLSLCFAYETEGGQITVAAIPVSSFLSEVQVGNGLQKNNNGQIELKINSNESYLQVDSNGLSTTSALETAISDSKTTITTEAADSTIPSSGNPKIVVTKTTNGSDNYTITGQDLASAILLQNEVTRASTQEDTIESAVGLNSDGTYITKSGTSYLNSATSIEGEIAALDTAIAGVAADVQSIRAITNAEIDSLFD